MKQLVDFRQRAQPDEMPRHVMLLQQQLLEKYGDAVVAVFFYGSCLHDIKVTEGVVDLYVVVDNYRAVNIGRLPAMADWLIPPSLHFMQLTNEGVELKAKYAIFSLADFLSGTSSRWFHGYLSARLAQPVAVLYTRDSEAKTQVYNALAKAVITLAARTIPMLPNHFHADQLWVKALQLSYASELRTERPGYPEKVMNRDRDYYLQALEAAVSDNALPMLRAQSQPDSYQSETSTFVRQWARASWALRRIQGKLLSILRLTKGLYTFEGGLDYLAWKLERHSGQKIVIPDKVRRRPLLHIWGLFWRLYRQGVFR